MAASMINTDFIRKHPAQAVLTVLGLSGVATIFLPFIFGDAPVEVFLDDLEYRNLLKTALLLGPYVVLPFFISAGYLRWALTGGLSRWEGDLGYALALIVVFLLSVFMIQDWWESGFDGDDWLFSTLFLPGLGAGAWFVIQNLRHKAPLTLTALVALQLAYLPFALFWLVFLTTALIKGDAFSIIGIGAYLTLLAVIVYTAQATLSVLGQRRVLLRLLPLALIWVSAVALFVWTWIEG